MLKTRRAMQILLVAMTCLSGILLGLSQANFQLMAIAVFGSIGGYIVADSLKLFQLKGWIANVSSIGVLIYSMSDFYQGDGASKLVSVSNLLVYLQTILMFQKKTQRLNWQVMVLSLLQAIVAAIFNLNFEGGLLFVVYFAVAGVALILQSNLVVNDVVTAKNRESAKRLKQRLIGAGTEVTEIPLREQAPITIFDFKPAASPALRKMVLHLSLWLAMGMVFTTLVFYSVPRSEKAWFAPKFRAMSQTGFTNRVNLDESGLIEQSISLQMRLQFFDVKTDQLVQVNGPIYVRGMALAHLEIDNDKTTWVAPYDRIHRAKFEPPRPKLGRRSNVLRQVFTLEATGDPLIYGVTPAASNSRTPQEIEFCHDLSAFTRVNSGEQIELATYAYEMLTRTDSTGQLLDAWPYRPEFNFRKRFPLDQNEGQRKWLTDLDRNRYPQLVQKASELEAEFRSSGGTSQYELMKYIENYFLNPNEYTYTLDYTNVDKDDSIDPVEDFVANHRTGHCELYASAMVLMLRSLGIPARLVVGFHTSEFSDVTDSYMVRANNAHAWVEAYLPSAECPQRLFDEGTASKNFGAWLRLDPTPPVPQESTGGTTIELARTLWQDYVLGLDRSKQSVDVQSTTRRMLGLFDLSNWSASADRVVGSVSSSPVLQVGLITVVLGFILIGMYRNYAEAVRKRKKSRKGKPAGLVRRIVGSALGIISPKLQKWVLGANSTAIIVPYYKRLTELLAKHGLRRTPGQTQREFAFDIANRIEDHPQRHTIQEVVSELTDVFYQIRFGQSELQPVQQQAVQRKLKELQALLTDKAKS